MKPEAQREAIYRAQGFVQGAELGYNSDQATLWYRPDPNGTYHDIPTWSKKYSEVKADPLTDLNAMHEAEKVLNMETASIYGRELAKIADRGVEFNDDTQIGPLDVFAWATFTAAQRAEAFLRTLNLWKPTQ